jgi:GTP cyclohydrolase II
MKTRSISAEHRDSDALQLVGNGIAASGAALPRAHVRARVTLPMRIAGEANVPAEIVTFNGLVDGREHVAVVFGDPLEQDIPLVRVHSECLTGDVLRSARCDCGPQLEESLAVLHEEGGILLYMRQEGRGIGLYNKLDAYRLQDSGMDTFEANRALNFNDDHRVYTTAAQMLVALGVLEVEILSNSPDKIRQLRALGVSIRRQRLTGVHLTNENRRYLETKMIYGGHLLSID